MRIKFSTRILSLAMAVATLLTVAACKPSGGEPTTTPTPTAGEDLSSPPFKRYDQTLTVTVLFADDGVTTFPEGSTWDDNAWTKAYLDELNVKIVSAGVASSYEYNNVIAQRLSAGNLPDVFQVDSNMMSTMIKAGAVAELTDLLDTYASAAAKNYFQYDTGILLESCKRDGKLYAVPKEDVVWDFAENIAIRTDWLDNLGLPEPKNWNDILRIIEEFSLKDPDGNGVKDTYGLALDFMVGDGILKGVADAHGFFTAYHAQLGRWIKKDGQLVYGTIQPEMKKPLQILADFYAKGYIDPGYYEKDRWAVQADIKAGKIGLAFQGFWAAANWDALYETLGDKLKFYPISTFDEQPTEYLLRNNATGAKMAVKKGFSNPEVLFKLYNMELRHGTGKEENEWKTFYDSTEYTKHKWAIVSPVSAPDNYISNYRTIQKVLNGELQESELPYQAREAYGWIKGFQNGENTTKSAWSAYVTAGPRNSVYSVIDHYLTHDIVKMEAFTGAPTLGMMQNGVVLQWEEIGMVNAIITGEQPLEYFDTWIQQWKQKGGEQITTEVNEWFQKNGK